MRAWVYVEGESDKLGLQSLWTNWREHLKNAGHGIEIIPLGNKSRFFRKIGYLAARHLCDSNQDIVVGLPDLYPNQEYVGGRFEHSDIGQLMSVQKKEVSNTLRNNFNVNMAQVQQLLERFLPSALKYDLEMLLLAAKDQLRRYLGTSHQLVGNWRSPVEDQNQNRPPKRIVEELFRNRSTSGNAYRDTKDASAILRNVADIKTIIYNANNQIECPVFKALLDWIGKKTTIPAYE